MLNKETINDKLRWVQQYLSEKGIEAARLEAEILFCHVLSKSRIELYRDLLQLFPEDKSGPLLELIQKRAQHEPIAYLTGKQEFMSLEFKVTPAVLIPRPETEQMVELLISELKAHPNPLLVDVGTGSGAIAVSLAKYLPKAKVIAVDISQAALQIAKENALTNGVNGQINFLHSNLLEALEPELKGKITALAANLPYIPEGERNHLQPDVRLYEPGLALFAGEDGFDLYRQLLPAAYEFLVPGGVLTLEIGYEQGGLVQETFSEDKWQEVKTIMDFQALDRLIYAVKR